MTKSRREPRKRVYMGVQQLEKADYDWLDTAYKGRYSDNIIVKNAPKFMDSRSRAYDIHNSNHYLYTVYQRYYWPLENEYRHDFNDYNFIFNNKNLRDKARLIMLHVAMRLEFFSFVDYKRNGKSRNKRAKKRQKFEPIKIASILHDADKSMNGTKIVKPHVHYALKLGKSVTPTQLSKWSGIPPQYFSTRKRSSRYEYGNMLAYLTHAKQPQKHLYNHKNVWSNKPILDYQAYYKSHHEQWTYQRANAQKKDLSIAKNLFLQEVRDGKITDQMTIRNKRYFDIRCSLTRNMTELFHLRARRSGYLLNKELHEGKFSISIFFIYGHGGSGKSQLGYRLKDDLHKLHPTWDVFPTASSNNGKSDIFDGYRGEPIVFMNEVKPDDLDPGAWETLLDPHYIQGLGSRYHNKVVSKRVIIMTTTYTPEMFFGLMKGTYSNVEEMGQFMRRLTTSIKFIRASGDNNKLDGKVLIRHPVKYDFPVTIPIKLTNGRVVKRKSRYVLEPSRCMAYEVIPEKESLKYMINVVDRNNSSRDHSNDPTYLTPKQYSEWSRRLKFNDIWRRNTPTGRKMIFYDWNKARRKHGKKPFATLAQFEEAYKKKCLPAIMAGSRKVKSTHNKWIINGKAEIIDRDSELDKDYKKTYAPYIKNKFSTNSGLIVYEVSDPHKQADNNKSNPSDKLPF